MDSAIVNTLGLCCGIGMLDEGVRFGLEYFGLRSRTAVLCEWEAYAAACLMARMEDASMEPAPIWCGDLTDFDGQAFHGLVDLLCSGFPCQPWSCAGKQAGTADDRWLWPAIANIIRDVGPELVFLENVPGLVSGGGLDHVLSDLAEMRFDAEWTSLTAEAVGASHRRERIFILGYSTGGNGRTQRTVNDRAFGQASAFGNRSEHLALSAQRGQRELREPSERDGLLDGCDKPLELAGRNGRRISQRRGQDRRTVIGGAGGALEYAECESSGGQPNASQRREDRGASFDRAGAAMAHTSGTRPQERRSERGNPVEELPAIERDCLDVFAPGPSADWRAIPEALWPAIEREFCGMVNGHSRRLDDSRTDRLRCLGNAVVPLQAAIAFISLVRQAGLISQ